MLAHHMILRLSDHRVIATRPADLRAMACLILRVAVPHGLVVFRCADTHVHIVVRCDRATAGQLARRIEIGLQDRFAFGIPFVPVHVEPVRSQRHLANAFHYVLRQEEHHGTRFDPCLEGSALADLLGLREVAPALRDNVRDALPRLSSADLHAHIDGPPPTETDASVEVVAEAAAAALGLPIVRGSTAPVVRARHAAAHACPAPSGVLAPVLHTSRRTITRLRASPADPALVRAIRRQAHLRTHLQPPTPTA